MKILSHVCCAPCFTYVHETMNDDGHTVTGFFYNPNIHPFEEYGKRRDSLVRYAEMKRVAVIYDDEYQIEEFLKGILACKNRCEYCYMDRLERTASLAAEEGFEAFTSTLLISPYQQHDLIREIGEKLSEEHDVPFFYRDFRLGYRDSRRLTFELGLYRQKYCGCIISEYERHRGEM